MDDDAEMVDPVTRVLHDAEAALASDPHRTEILRAIARAARWGDAAARLAMNIQPSTSVDRARQLVTDEARRATGARAVTLGTREEEPVGSVSAEPLEIEHFTNLTRALSTQVPYRVEEVLERAIGGFHAIVVPMRARLAGRGAIIAWYDQALSPSELLDREHLAAFAEQAALSLDRAQAVEDRAALAVVSDRERIARDLHDVVIQRLFATGLQLQALGVSLTDPAQSSRIEAAVDALDETIHDIRRTIFELQHGGSGPLRTEVREVVREYVGNLGHTPVLRTRGAVDTAITASIRKELLAVLRTALADVAREARAGTTEITVTIEGETATEVVLTVSDDGLDPDVAVRQGQDVVRRRAEELGGSFSVSPRIPRGSVLRWAVPLGQSAEA